MMNLKYGLKYGKLLSIVYLMMLANVCASQVLSIEKQQQLSHLVKQDCGSCHGMRLKGGLGPSLLPVDLQTMSIENLTTVILNGRPSLLMPAWQGILSETEVQWIAVQLKRGSWIF